ncbi:hypothetical protein E2C01_053818 [Portunus trituberculatus]|uniref:Uncharacterized protein n=1 Tax=Portunus trituberculatus TaxID=210409 RepID=A0A5B7GHQ7_PORTR|nr:hypothetical protein [Portunus trituberculatus]
MRDRRFSCGNAPGGGDGGPSANIAACTINREGLNGTGPAPFHGDIAEAVGVKLTFGIPGESSKAAREREASGDQKLPIDKTALRGEVSGKVAISCSMNALNDGLVGGVFGVLLVALVLVGVCDFFGVVVGELRTTRVLVGVRKMTGVVAGDFVGVFGEVLLLDAVLLGVLQVFTESQGTPHIGSLSNSSTLLAITPRNLLSLLAPCVCLSGWACLAGTGVRGLVGTDILIILRISSSFRFLLSLLRSQLPPKMSTDVSFSKPRCRGLERTVMQRIKSLSRLEAH